MSSEPTEVHHEEHGEHGGMDKKAILKIALWLSLITGVEFIIALWLVPNKHIALHWANPLYIGLTLLKAFLIVAYFMHLKFEKIGLALAIIVPILFIIGLILVLTNESHYWVDLMRPAVKG